MGFRTSRFWFPAIPLSCHPNYRALTFALAGLSPAEHTSLSWLQPSHQPVPQTPIDVLPDEVIGLHDRTLVEVAAPATKKATDDGDGVLRCVRVPLWRRAFVDSS